MEYVPIWNMSILLLDHNRSKNVMEKHVLPDQTGFLSGQNLSLASQMTCLLTKLISRLVSLFCSKDERNKMAKNVWHSASILGFSSMAYHGLSSYIGCEPTPHPSDFIVILVQFVSACLFRKQKLCAFSKVKLLIKFTVFGELYLKPQCSIALQSH